MTKVKICGLTTYEDALASAQAGADMLGFNFFKQSPRYISPDDASALCRRLRDELGADCPLLIGLFVNEAVGVISVTCEKVGLRFVQLSGDESVEMVTELKGMAYKSIRPPNKVLALDDANYFSPAMPTDERIPSLLLDAYHPKLYGGTGEQASVDVALAVKAIVPRMMLAGGLTPENVGERVRQIQPWGVDVASGVEIEPGRKDAAKVRTFVEAVREQEVV